MRGKGLQVLLAVAAAGVLSGCGGGGSAGNDVPAVATANTTVAVSSAVTGALVSTAFAFPSGVTSFGTTSATTVTFNDTTPIPAFTITSGGHTAIGTITGSCSFKIASSDFPAPSPLEEVKTVTVNPCNVKINTTGQVANGAGQPRNVELVLGANASSVIPITVSVTASGQVTLNGATVGTVVLSNGTGATGGS
jgi:hypothetical protein